MIADLIGIRATDKAAPVAVHTQENTTDCGQIPAAASDGLERDIDLQVYGRYGLTPEEIKIVEEAKH